MLRVTIKINSNIAASAAKIRAAGSNALTATGNQALADTTMHVPKDQGYLRNSGLSNSSMTTEDLKFILRWDEPYAQYLFHGEVMYGNPTNRTYGPKKLKFTEALARMEWTKYAAEVYGDDWRAVMQAALRREL